jgi:hypothetical protein
MWIEREREKERELDLLKYVWFSWKISFQNHHHFDDDGGGGGGYGNGFEVRELVQKTVTKNLSHEG